MRTAAEQANRPDGVEIVLYVDEDDPDSHALNSGGLRSATIVGPRASMGVCNTACLRRSVGDIVVLCNDDVMIRTPGWDEKIRQTDVSVPDGIYLAYPNDLFKGENLCAFPVISRRTCELLSDPFPADYRGAFIDYHLLDIFKRLQRLGALRILYMPNVIFEHMHFRARKSSPDKTYRDRSRFGDDDTFLRLCPVRRASAVKLANALGLPSSDSPSTPLQLQNDGRVGLLEATVLDRQLPLKWSVRLFLWFVARMVTRWGVGLLATDRGPALQGNRKPGA